ncbi:response regulator [Segetibacter sp.]|jgi:two-component system sensor histidine kinase/response regulator|uniref:hybrid sensor histidine kinase/response regulator n=1 Tax=Segetibacter sp. TaxID=2231182 RepID=UPI0026055B49|nr:response regulator [Segetibacter sp.]MCW3081384.1 Hybrid sensor histidine kinase/response regulator [Segetibacter sp.]
MEQQTRIQVIEDEINIRENIQELLEAKGYVVRVSPNGKQGVLDAIDFKPNLIVCDVMMPKMDGYKVLEYVRKTSIIQNTPFIFLTARVDKNDIRQGMDLGADDYLTKPFTYKELLKAIESRLKRQQKIIGEYAKVKHDLDTTVFATYYHEFNTPLHGILGGLNLMLNARDSFNEQQVQELLTSILKSGLRLNHSLANLMLFEEIRRAEVYPELLSMFTEGIAKINWVQKVKTELQTMSKEIYNRIDDVVIDLEAAEVRMGGEYLQRIILELVDNALKFSKRGAKVYVTGSANGDEYRLEVKDSGRGFELQSLGDIAPFKQFNRKRFEQQGLGIGLFLVKRLTELNNGDLRITTSEGEGTQVEVNLLSAENRVSNITQATVAFA